MRWACPFERIHGDGYPAFFIEDTGIICVACDPFNYWAMGLEDFADIGALQANPFGESEQCLVAHTATHRPSLIVCHPERDAAEDAPNHVIII